MATPTTAKPARKRVKLVKFDVPDSDAISKLVLDGKLTVVNIPARDATEKRKAQPERTEYLPNARAGVLGLYGGNEKAANLGAALYWSTYIKRMNSKGKVADPDRAINRTAETLSKVDLTGMPQDVIDAIRTLQERAAAVPVAPKARKSKAKEASATK